MSEEFICQTAKDYCMCPEMVKSIYIKYWDGYGCRFYEELECFIKNRRHQC